MADLYWRYYTEAIDFCILLMMEAVGVNEKLLEFDEFEEHFEVHIHKV